MKKVPCSIVQKTLTCCKPHRSGDHAPYPQHSRQHIDHCIFPNCTFSFSSVSLYFRRNWINMGTIVHLSWEYSVWILCFPSAKAVRNKQYHKSTYCNTWATTSSWKRQQGTLFRTPAFSIDLKQTLYRKYKVKELVHSSKHAAHQQCKGNTLQVTNLSAPGNTGKKPRTKIKIPPVSPWLLQNLGNGLPRNVSRAHPFHVHSKKQKAEYKLVPILKY